jgi:hypothetical protein
METIGESDVESWEMPVLSTVGRGTGLFPKTSSRMSLVWSGWGRSPAAAVAEHRVASRAPLSEEEEPEEEWEEEDGTDEEEAEDEEEEEVDVREDEEPPWPSRAAGRAPSAWSEGAVEEDEEPPWPSRTAGRASTASSGPWSGSGDEGREVRAGAGAEEDSSGDGRPRLATEGADWNGVESG